MFDPLIARAGLPAAASLADVVDAVHRIPFGAPSVRTAEGTLAEWRGTGATKHALLAAALRRRWPHTEPRLVHRVHHCPRDRARELFGEPAARVLPEDGLWDVHRYLTLALDGRRVVIDVTYPAMPGWDGASSMPVAAEPGTDHEAGPDADREKRVLEAAHCDPAVRESFLAALTASLATA
ncbi:hypothetical protein LG943_04035 [Streptomonospora sp. S1-112]|uniref:Uncharacterized protein n=1 Tax=Streptomonospora mangrovi TaxID=2883123 RepID=A0A9X3SCC3_9ACTN|nr:hypothetical protein [Streptomonospora mangrovi]MDA0563503.1 hypothetical protein [Streptomonospora mangrovi]